MAGRIEGKVALVTGGGRGIGEAIASAFVREGASVAVLDRQLSHATATAEKLEAAGGTAMAVAADVSDEAAVISAVEAVTRMFGRIDILVNNAGISTHGSEVRLTRFVGCLVFWKVG